MVLSTAAKPSAFPSSFASRFPRIEPNPIHSAMESLGTVLQFGRGRAIYDSYEPAKHCYEVISGTVRTYKVLQDGRRQIGSFYSTGDVFGLEAGEMHVFCAEALTDCKLLAVNQASIAALASKNGAFQHQLWLVLAIELEQARKHMLLLMKTARERVAMFILQMAKRSVPGTHLELPMPRRDIADYLGLTIETVSRELTQLTKQAIIEVPTSRQIILRSPAALSRIIE